MTKILETIDAETLMTTPFAPIDFLIQGLLAEGLHILAGAPKIGKSWLSLWICLRVSQGKKVWDFETKQCSVLYLCLEDNFSRIQNRLFQITDDAPSTLHFATMCGAIGQGLEEQILNFIETEKNTRIIVIDTLQKVRTAPTSNTNLYANDYEDINALKKIADKNKLAIVLVHHLRKSKDSDPLNMISGTSGISGAADSNFVLQKDNRTANTAQLICTGRDIEDLVLPLELNKDSCVWELLSPVALREKKVDPLLFILCDYIKSVGHFIGTATELAEQLKTQTDTEITPSVLKKKIVQHMDFIVQNEILYSDKRNFKRREFTLTYQANDGNDGMT
ncbi:MAG: AAA family ATPase [Bacillota bacterium]